MRRKLLFGLALVASAAAVLWAWRGRTVGLDATEAAVRARYPDVQTVSTDDLARALESETPPAVLDVREPGEYAVSHIPGAVRMDPQASGEAVIAALDSLPPGRDVVVYCSVGYRSAETARKMQEAGARRVFNLEGSAFRWASEGRPLEGTEGARGLVHPYNDVWGRLLAPEHRAPLAE